MKHYLLSLLMIVAPVLAAEDLAGLTAEQRAKCSAEGGCYVLTRLQIEAVWQMGAAEGLAACKGAI